MGRVCVPGCGLFFLLIIHIVLRFLLLEASFCDRQKECAFEAVLLAMLARRGLRVRKDVTSAYECQ